MKTLKLNIDFSDIDLAEQEKLLAPQKLTSNVIENMIIAFGQQRKGISEPDRKKYYKLTDAIEAAVKAGADTVELEDDWMGFLRQCFRECNYIPNKVARRVEEVVLAKE